LIAVGIAPGVTEIEDVGKDCGDSIAPGVAVMTPAALAVGVAAGVIDGDGTLRVAVALGIAVAVALAGAIAVITPSGLAISLGLAMGVGLMAGVCVSVGFVVAVAEGEPPSAAAGCPLGDGPGVEVALGVEDGTGIPEGVATGVASGLGAAGTTGNIIAASSVVTGLQARCVKK